MDSTGLSGAAGLSGIALGPDGALWYAEHSVARIGRISSAPGTALVDAADVTSAAATLTGTVRPNGEATSAYLEWGPTTSYGSSSTPPPWAAAPRRRRSPRRRPA